jgi:predicted nucleotidyltransferase
MDDSRGSSVVHRGNVDALRCPSEVKGGLLVWAGRVTRALGQELAGIYLYGSLPHGCFHPATSDVDVVVVTEGFSSEAVISEIVKAHVEAAIPVDATFVTRCQIEVDETPTPVDFVVKPMDGGKLVRLPEGHGDFLLQRQDLYECEAALTGQPVCEVVRPVPWEALSRCLDDLFPHILSRFKNPALMLCRAAYAFTHRSLCSKKAAGEWALRAFDESWRPLIQAALARYADGVADDSGPDQVLRAFEGYCAGYMARVRGAV